MRAMRSASSSPPIAPTLDGFSIQPAFIKGCQRCVRAVNLKNSNHVLACDHKDMQVGTPEMKPVACYLDVEAIIEIAKAQKVDAIHPGYFPSLHITHKLHACDLLHDLQSYLM